MNGPNGNRTHTLKAKRIGKTHQRWVICAVVVESQANIHARNRIYVAIRPRARELGMGHEEVHVFAFEELKLRAPITSLKELGEQKLERLRDKLRALKRKRG